MIWTEGETERVTEFYADNYRADYPMGSGWGEGVAGVRAFAEAIRTGFPDYREEIEELIVQGNKVAVRLRIRGTHQGMFMGHQATGKTIDFRDMTICTVRNGKIICQSGLSDYLTVFCQLGLIDPTTL